MIGKSLKQAKEVKVPVGILNKVDKKGFNDLTAKRIDRKHANGPIVTALLLVLRTRRKP